MQVSSVSFLVHDKELIVFVIVIWRPCKCGNLGYVPEKEPRFWELEDCTGAAKSAIGICRTNTFTRNGDKQMLGCFLQGARFNHSCRPNVVWYWGDKTDAVLKMHVTKD